MAPDDKLRFDNSGCNKAPTKNIGYEKALNHGLEFRLRFKLPLASKLLEIDKAAFNYYYKQVKRDYLKNIVCKPEDKAANGKQNTRLEWIYLCPLPVAIKLFSCGKPWAMQLTTSIHFLLAYFRNTSSDPNGKPFTDDNNTPGKNKSSWYRSNKLLKPFELGKQGDDEGQKKSKLLARITILSSLIMAVDMVENNLNQASVIKNVENYLPNTVWKHHNRMIEMMFRVHKEHVEKQIEMWMAQGLSVEELKTQFLQLFFKK